MELRIMDSDGWCPRFEELGSFTCKEMRPGMFMVFGNIPEATAALSLASRSPLLFVSMDGCPTLSAEIQQVRIGVAQSLTLSPEEQQHGGVLFLNTLEAIQDFTGQYIPGWSLSNLKEHEEKALTHPVSPLGDLIIREMLAENLPSMLQRLALEKGWLQIMTMELEYLSANWSAKTDKPKELFLTKTERDQLDTARHLLEENMTSPPDVKTLSRMVGMNHFKLKKGFKQLFGQPPMTYLRSYRMRKAKELLLTHTMSVTQVAMEVGYSNPSSFSAKFSEQFGCKPKDVK